MMVMVRKTIKSDLNLNENFNLIDFKWSEPKLNINEDYKDYLIKDKQLDLFKIDQKNISTEH